MIRRRFGVRWFARGLVPGDRASLVIASAVLLASGFGLLILLPAWIGGLGYPESAEWIRSFFRGLCHQRPERSFALWGEPFAVCARCSGFYLGAIVGLSIGGTLIVRRGVTARPVLLLLASAPTAADVVANWVGLAALPSLGRFASAIPAGAVLAWFLAEGLTDLFARPVNPASLDRSCATLRATGGG